ncbi:butyrophilin subfamily 1 member A1-like isoform X2 [Strix aluco]|uniref:butyrophilin subfamily 1 member A1-like isoform X2 n=1 Tax=Strix aluco TaxID=111821 RepID=UPI003DA25EC8
MHSSSIPPLVFSFFLSCFGCRGGAWTPSKAHDTALRHWAKPWRCLVQPCASRCSYPSNGFRVVGPGYPLRATVGQDVVLPCHLSPPKDARSLEILWIRHQFSEIVHHYRNGEDQYNEQLRAYWGRTELVRAGLSNGSLDLRILGLRPSDDGQYICTVQNADSYAEASVELEVAVTGSVPQLSLEAYEDGGIQVLCRSAGWYPQPQVLWKDAGGQHLPSVSQRHSSDERGLFAVEDATVVSGSVSRNFSCVVRNSRLNQEQESSLHISAPFFHNAHPWMVALAVLLVLLVALMGLSAFLWRRKEKQDAALAWRKFLLPENPDMVTMDPDTAHSRLVLSEDRRSVRLGSTRKDLPDIFTRFSERYCVLGQEGFTEGRHCWEVEGDIGGDCWWGMGVARDNIERKGYMDVVPEEGFWVLWHYRGHFESLTSPRTVLSLSPMPSRILVCLDYTEGLVTFINVKTGGEIFTFPPDQFNGVILRPFFWVRTMNTKLRLRGGSPQPH